MGEKYKIKKDDIPALFATAEMLMENNYHNIYSNKLGWKQGSNKNFSCLNAGAHSKGTDTNPSLSVDNETGMWHCFTCGIKGNIQSYWTEYLKGGKGGVSYTDWIVDFLGMTSTDFLKISTSTTDPDFEKNSQQIKHLYETLKEDRFKKTGKQWILSEELCKVAKETKVIPMDQMDEWVDMLLADHEALNYLKQTRNINEDVIKKYRIGMNKYGKFMFPVINAEGQLINVKAYDPRCGNPLYKWSYPFKGYENGPVPINNFTQQKIYFFGGEPDCYCAIAMGIAGAVTFGSEAITDADKVFGQERARQIFLGKEIVISLDSDETGVASANKLAKSLYPYAKQIKIINLDKSEINPNGLEPSLVKEIGEGDNKKVKRSEKDFTDFIKKNGFGVEAMKLFEKIEADTLRFEGNKTPTANNFEENLFLDAPFTPLGYDKGTYYYYSKVTKQIVVLKVDQHREGYLSQLADREWFDNYKSGKAGPDWKAIADDLIQLCHHKGVFRPEMFRGRGAYWDDEQIVIYLGGEKIRCLTLDSNNCLIEDTRFLLNDFQSRYAYEIAPAYEDVAAAIEPLSPEKCGEILSIAQSFPWTDQSNGLLLAGWCVIAPVCGVLPWRPHEHITGPSGSGKTTLLERFVIPLVGPSCLNVSSCTTEAGLRQETRSDARPVAFDEIESENKHGAERVQKVLELFRQASSESGSKIIKGTQSGQAFGYTNHCCALLSSIGIPQTQRADISRFTILSLKVNDSPHATQQFSDLLERIAITITPGNCAALREKTIRQIPTILANIKVFKSAISARSGSARAGDQLGALFAGAYSLVADEKVTLEDANKWLIGIGYSNEAINDNAPDEVRCLNRILEYKLRITNLPYANDLSIGELIIGLIMKSDTKQLPETQRQAVAESKSQEIITDADFTNTVNRVFIESEIQNAHATLKRHGIRVDCENQLVFISNTYEEIGKILADSNWPRNWGTILQRLPGAKATNAVRFNPGVGSTRATSIPFKVFIEG